MAAMTQLTCILCPKGCRLRVEEENDYRVSGNSCERGAAYGRDELMHPVRVVTSTVRAEGGAHRRCPVKTDGGIPKERVLEAMRLLDGITVSCPVRRGQVIVENVLGTGVSFVATRDL